MEINEFDESNLELFYSIQSNNKLFVYVAGPYSSPDPVINTKIAMEIGDLLEDTGKFIAYIPHLSMFRHLLHNRQYDYWLIHGLIVLKRCDCMIRIPGKSRGTIIEQSFASINDIPVLEITETMMKNKNCLLKEFSLFADTVNEKKMIHENKGTQ